ncbi:MAG: hypothetical protein WA784_17015 [Albidovulum sp.]
MPKHTDDGGPHVEITGRAHDSVTTERGWGIGRISGRMLTEATRWYVFGMAQEHALSAELRDREAPIGAAPTQYGLKEVGYLRLNCMVPTIEIMHRVSSDFGNWANQHFLSGLDQYPPEDHEVQNAWWPIPQKSNAG